MSEAGQKLIAAVRKAAADNPDFIYPLAARYGSDGSLVKFGNCMYVKDGCPSCIVGKGAWDLRLIDASFEFSDDNSAAVDVLLSALDLYDEVDGQELGWLMAVQKKQDNSTPWGEAVAEADGRYPQCGES